METTDRNSLAISNLSDILKEGNLISETLEKICEALPSHFSEPENVAAEVEWNAHLFRSIGFRATTVFLKKEFYMYDDGWCYIRVMSLSEQPFSEADVAMFEMMMSLLMGFYVTSESSDIEGFSTERLKGLATINRASRLFLEQKPLRETFEQLCEIIPRAMRYPRLARAKITYGTQTYLYDHFNETGWSIHHDFKTQFGDRVVIEIFYLKEVPKADVGPFLKIEIYILKRFSKMLEVYINQQNEQLLPPSKPLKIEKERLLNPRPLLQRFLNNQNYGRDALHGLMPFRVREVLLIARLYDAFCLENEGTIASSILGEFYQFNLSEVPHITGATTKEEAMEWLQNKHFDLVILMMGVNQILPTEISQEIRQNYPFIPIVLLLNNNSDIYHLEQNAGKLKSIDDVYVWNGDSRIFFAMIKILEDRINVENDTKLGLVRVVLLVEDSPRYYSRYLPLLYSGLVDQTHRILDEVGGNEMEKMVKVQVRPKILHATTYEDAIELVQMYENNLLCIITDVRFWSNGKLDEHAGIRLVNQVRTLNHDLPIVIQSSDIQNKQIAQVLNTAFIDKNSETLLQDIKDFIIDYLGFGDFVFRNSEGKIHAVARTMVEFEQLLPTIPDDIMLYHARRNHFSLWYMVRGEVNLAKILKLYHIDDFMTGEEVREFVLGTILRYRSELQKGKMVQFDDIVRYDDQNIVSMNNGLIGGKGRGIMFLNSLINSIDYERFLPDINIRTPRTFVVGSEAFDKFLNLNNLKHKLFKMTDYVEIRKMFKAAKLPIKLSHRIRELIKMSKKPLAVRSSGLFEDSQLQPFAGIFETYMIPNSHPNFEERVQQCEEAIKMVYASVFSKVARDYITAVQYKLEEEKMAVIIQEVVGQQHERYFYPHISGVAQSFNYYPIGHMEPEDGFVQLAVGMGCYVVDGELCYGYCPKYPQLEIHPPEKQIQLSQTHFYAVDLEKYDLNLNDEGENAGLIKLDISVARNHGTLNHTASIYSVENQCFQPGVSGHGKPIINFRNVLKYNYIPLSKTIETVMQIMQEAMGCPVEMEFAVDLTPDDEGRSTFYILQIKPLTSNRSDYHIDPSTLQRDAILLYSEKVSGNGVIEGLTDVIYVDLNQFDKTKTPEIAQEIATLNQKMKEENRHYLLIGPGRWGSRDRFIGIPVQWTQISHAQAIVETSFEGFPLEASSGSHFFHHVTSQNIGYFSLQHTSSSEWLCWDLLQQQNCIEETKYCKHVRFEQPFKVKIDGKRQVGVVEVETSH